MSELINTYLIKNPYDMVSMNREDFYSEQIETFKKSWKPSKYVEVIGILLFDEKWNIILQKRSNNKKHNPNLLDKSVGGHIVHWDTADYTISVESLQELQVPSFVLKNDEDFERTYTLLKEYTSNVAIIKKVDVRLTSNVIKKIHGTNIVIGNKTHMYFWIYSWAIRHVDSEAKWVIAYALDDLVVEMKQHPETFTNDLFDIFQTYNDAIYSFRDYITTY